MRTIFNIESFERFFFHCGRSRVQMVGEISHVRSGDLGLLPPYEYVKYYLFILWFFLSEPINFKFKIPTVHWAFLFISITAYPRLMRIDNVYGYDCNISTTWFKYFDIYSFIIYYLGTLQNLNYFPTS